jgi:hypothetical protein
MGHLEVLGLGVFIARRAANAYLAAIRGVATLGARNLVVRPWRASF